MTVGALFNLLLDPFLIFGWAVLSSHGARRGGYRYDNHKSFHLRRTFLLRLHRQYDAASSMVAGLHKVRQAHYACRHSGHGHTTHRTCYSRND